MLAGIAAVAFAATCTNGAVRLTAASAPELALRIRSNDAMALARASADRIKASSSATRLDRAAAEARRALARDPTQAQAVGSLAMIADMRGRTAQAEAMFNMSDRLSRRDLVTRLWLIERHVQRGDIAGALGNFDIALRTSDGVGVILYPILIEALNDDTIAPQIGRLLATRPPWLENYLAGAIPGTTGYRQLTRILLSLTPAPIVHGEDARAMMMRQMIAIREYGLARQLASAQGSRADGRSVTDPGFADPRGIPPFTWQFSAQDSIIAERSVAVDSPGLTVTVEPDATGVAAEQLLALAPGARRLCTKSAGSLPRSAVPAPQWTLTCAGQGETVLATLDLPTAGEEGCAAVSVPANACSAQWLRLMMRPSPDSDGYTAAVRSVTVR